MNAISIQVALTMTSREMADLTEKRHDNVRRTIDTLAEKGVISQPQIEDGEKSANGVMEKLYRIGKRDSYIIVAQLSPEFTARLVDRWQELEAQFTIPRSMSEALRLAADLSDKVVALEIESANQKKFLEVAQPKAEAFDLVSASRDTLTVTEASKVLGVKRTDLSAYLHKEGWVYRQNGSWVAYDKFIKNGCLQYKEAAYTSESSGMEVRKPYCHITSKGLTKLSLMLMTDLEKLAA